MFDPKKAPICPYCGEDAALASGRDVYPHRKDLFTELFYLCRPCWAYVGVHRKTVIPMGTLANTGLRRLRSKAHSVFDKTWKQGHMTREEAYKLMASSLGIDFDDAHIGMFDEEQCQAVIGIFS